MRYKSRAPVKLPRIKVIKPYAERCGAIRFIKALIAAKTPKIKRKESKIIKEGASFKAGCSFS